MPNRASILLALCGLLVPPGTAAAQATDRGSGQVGEIRGRVFGGRGDTAFPLPHAMLDLSRGFDHRTVATDSLGRYRARGLAPGRWRVQAIHIGYDGIAVEVLVPAGGSVELDMELSSRPIPIPSVTIRALPLAEAQPRESPSTREMGEIALRALEGSTGMVEAGLAQVVRSLPGSDQAEPTDVLLMRGSAADLKLVLLDGAPIYTPFHLGGLVDSFDPGALGGASLFLGGAPARFDGGLSYILDLTTRSPRRDRLRGEFGADLLTGRMLLEGPLPGGGFLFGTRAIHDLGTPILDRGDSPYGYRDLLVRGEWGGRDRASGFLTGFWNQEDVRLDLGSSSFSDGARWGNQALSGGLQGFFGKTSAEVRGALSRYEAHLPVSDSLPLFARSRSDRLRVTADFSLPLGAGTLRLGASLDGVSSDYEAQRIDAGGSSIATDLVLRGTTGGVYAEGDGPVGENLNLRAGLRVDHFSESGGVHLAPRAALTWLLTDNAVLTLAAGRYHQFSTVSSSVVEQTLATLADDTTAVGTGSRLSVGKANHLVVSLDQILLPGLRLGLEGYVKNFSGVTGAEGQRLNASGVDLRVAREGDRTSGWVGYTLTWFWASDQGFLGSDARFSGRHLLSAGLSTRLSDRTGIRVRVGYGDGLPYTSIPLFQDAASSIDQPGTAGRETFALEGDNLLNEAPGLAIGPDEGFLRVEGEIFGSWAPTIAGRTTQLRPYVRILNALNRRDALFYHFDPWRDPSPRPLAELPILPLVGLEWIF